MKKLQSIILCITISLLCFTPIEVFAEEANQKIILIDPGHGGFDGGAKSKSGVI